jgi:hypothetical protein
MKGLVHIHESGHPEFLIPRAAAPNQQLVRHEVVTDNCSDWRPLWAVRIEPNVLPFVSYRGRAAARGTTKPQPTRAGGERVSGHCDCQQQGGREPGTSETVNSDEVLCKGRDVQPARREERSLHPASAVDGADQ